MPPKAPVTTPSKAPVITLSTVATTLGSGGDTGKVDTNLQLVIVS